MTEAKEAEACGRRAGGSSRGGALEGRGRAAPGGAVEDDGGWFPITFCCTALAPCAFRLKRHAASIIHDDDTSRSIPIKLLH